MICNDRIFDLNDFIEVEHRTSHKTTRNMDVTSAACMKREMEEMAVLLKEIQGGARDLTDSSIEKLLKVKRLTGEQKREKATSAWAKSKCNRAKRIMVDKEIIPDTVVNSDVAKSEKVVRVRSASYSFGMRYKEVEKAEMGNIIYDVNIESSSNRKRVISNKFSTASRLSEVEKNKNQPNSDSNPTDKVDSELEVDANNKTEDSNDSDHNDCGNKAAKRTKKNQLREDRKRETLPFKSPIERSSKVYSFPKSSRETVEKGSTAGVSGDIDTAEKALRPHVMSAIMRPASVTRRVPDNDSHSENQNNIPEIASNSPDIMAHLDALSSRIRATSYTMHKDTVKTMNPAVLWRVKGTPGPGEYDPDAHIQSGTVLVLILVLVLVLALVLVLVFYAHLHLHLHLHLLLLLLLLPFLYVPPTLSLSLLSIYNYLISPSHCQCDCHYLLFPPL